MSTSKPASPRLHRSHRLAQGLVLGAPMGEGSGTVIYDHSGNDNHGTLQSGASWSSEEHGHCISLDGGANGYVDLTGSLRNIPLRAPMTVAMFVKGADYNAGGKHVGAWDDTGAKYSWLLTTGANDLFFYCLQAGSGLGLYETETTTDILVNGTPYFIGGTIDSSNNVYVYVNTSRTGPGAFSFNATAIGANLWYGAGKVGGSSTTRFTGKQDGLAIYNRALSQNEMADLCADFWAKYRPRPLRINPRPVVMSGGLTLGGSFGVRTTSHNTMAGGLVLGGRFTGPVTYNITMAGGLTLGGAFLDVGDIYVSVSHNLTFSPTSQQAPYVAQTVTFSSSVLDAEPGGQLTNTVYFASRAEAVGGDLATGRYRR